mmetsp:Transcript_61722/g.98355  ORF Transcript_61722/g.98355 Transcript_61722/m.98355 type:complete len:89 (-) Transcript_61722:30-296(-)
MAEEEEAPVEKNEHGEGQVTQYQLYQRVLSESVKQSFVKPVEHVNRKDDAMVIAGGPEPKLLQMEVIDVDIELSKLNASIEDATPYIN